MEKFIELQPVDVRKLAYTEMPESLTFIGWRKFNSTLSNDAEILQNILKKFNSDYGECIVMYK